MEGGEEILYLLCENNLMKRKTSLFLGASNHNEKPLQTVDFEQGILRVIDSDL